MYSSTSRKRPKSSPKTPNFNTISNNNHSPSKSQNPNSSTITSIVAEFQPPPNLLPSKSSEFLNLFLVLVVAVTVSVSCFVISDFINRHPLPFCDSDVTDSFISIPDSCELCPSNGKCYNGQLECNEGYKKYGRLCIQDGYIYEAAKKLSGWAKDRLCEAHAQYMCDDGTGAIWVSEDNLKNMLDKDGPVQGLLADDIKYRYAKEKAMEDITGLLDTRTISYGVKELKCPDILAESYKPMTCRARQWIAKNFLFIMAIFTPVTGITVLFLRIRRRWYLTKRADQLYHQVCITLEDNALMSRDVGDREPWLVASRLRDHLLTTNERRDPLLWKMVEKLVESDSRLDRYPKLVKGESKVVWEWQVEGSLSSSRKKSAEIGNLNSSSGTNRLNVRKHQHVEMAVDYNDLKQMS